ncbi:M23 family metallopeptidase [Turicibacter sanguinis]|uniref:M23 family metallopeptidase n=1 Tax=Turicibacter sanguinis TaxID=154288 RepID=UPI00399BEE78
MDSNIRYTEKNSTAPIIQRDSTSFTIKVKKSKLNYLKSEIRLSSQQFHSNQVKSSRIYFNQRPHIRKSQNKKAAKKTKKTEKFSIKEVVSPINNLIDEDKVSLVYDVKESAKYSYSTAKTAYKVVKKTKELIKPPVGVIERKHHYKSMIKDGVKSGTKYGIKKSYQSVRNLVDDDPDSLFSKTKTNAKATYRATNSTYRLVNQVNSFIRKDKSSKSANRLLQRSKELRKKAQRQAYHVTKNSVSSIVQNQMIKQGIGKIMMMNPIPILIGVLLLLLIVIPSSFMMIAAPIGIVEHEDQTQVNQFHTYVSSLDNSLMEQIQLEYSDKEDTNDEMNVLSDLSDEEINKNEQENQEEQEPSRSVIFDFSNLYTNSRDLLAYFGSKYPNFKFEEIRSEIDHIHQNLYTVQCNQIENEVYVWIEKIEVKDYLEMNKDVLFTKSEYENYLFYVEIQELLNNSELAAPYDGVYYYSSRFGYRTNPVNGVQEFHTGLDIPHALGTPIKATMSGIVTVVGYDSDGYGNYTVIKDGNRETLYAHCQEILVSVGQQVRVGERIALTGSTGMSTGPHLHLEYKIDGERLNPEHYLPKIE